jgi:prolipoprotein diacylglyceryltransferase
LILLVLVRKRARRDGWVLAVCVTLYSIGRGVASLWQPGEPFLFGLTQMQALSIGFSAVGVVLLMYLRCRAQP